MYQLHKCSVFANKAQWKLENDEYAQIDKFDEIHPFKSLIGHTNYISDLVMSRNNFGKLFSVSYDKTVNVS